MDTNDLELKRFFGNKLDQPKQVGGDHYLKAIQPWDIIRAWELNYWEGNIVKYVLRHQYKNKLEDIEKAIHYLEFIRDNYEELYEPK
jgi:hypothetical protein